jgi:hypothetical protein
VSGGWPNGWYVTEALFENESAKTNFFRLQHLYGGNFSKHHRLLSRQWQRGLQRARARDADLIISAENLWSASDHCLRALQANLQHHGYEIEVWAYVRPWREWQNSLWAQKLLGFGQFPQTSGNDIRHQVSVRFWVERLWQLFGRERVRIVRFDPSTFPHRCVVRHFASEIGLSVPFDCKLQANERLSRPAAQLAYCYHLWVRPKGIDEGKIHQHFRRIRRQLVCLAGPKVRFHDDLMEPFMDDWASQDHWLEAELGFRLDYGWNEKDGVQAIRTPDDLLALEPETLDWLARQSGLPRMERPARTIDEALVARQLASIAQWRPDLSVCAQEVGLRFRRAWIRWSEAC